MKDAIYYLWSACCLFGGVLVFAILILSLGISLKIRRSRIQKHSEYPVMLLNKYRNLAVRAFATNAVLLVLLGVVLILLPSSY